MMQRWPALKLEEDDIGYWSYDAGVMDCCAAFNCLKKEALFYGTELNFNTKVVHIDDDEAKVKLENGKDYKADQLVVACGWETVKLKSE